MVTLPRLPAQVVYDIFDRAMATHPYMPGCDNGQRPHLVMIEAARLIKDVFQAWLDLQEADRAA